MGLEPFFIGFPMSRTHDAVSKFTEYDHRNCGSLLLAQDRSDLGRPIDKRR